MLKIIYASILILLTGSVSCGMADDFHFVNQLIGERAAGLGGAYTAISDNAAGCYYNPAGIVYNIGSDFSASVNAFSTSTKTYKGALKTVDGKDQDWEKVSSVILPNFFGTVYSFKSFKVGFSYAVPDSVQREQEQHFANIEPASAVYSLYSPNAVISDYTININDVDKTFLFGPTVAYKFNNDFSAGLTIYGYYRNKTEIINQRITFSDTSGSIANDYQWLNSYKYKTEYGIRPILGTMLSVGDNISIGLTYSRLFKFSNSEKAQDSQQQPLFLNQNPSYSFLINENDSTTNAHDNLNIGFAWFPNNSLLVSADIKYYRSNENSLDDVINFSIGSEYYVSDTYAVRAGLYTDFANTPDLKAGLQNQPEHIDLYGATLNVCRFTRNTSTTLGVGYTFGTGDAQVKAGTQIQEAVVSTLTAYLSASYSF